MGVYMLIDGIQGDATQENHVGWLNVRSLDWQANRDIITPVGAARNREAREARLGDISFTKEMDGASAQLLQEACTGAKGKKVTIDLVRTSEGGALTYVQYKLEDALISGYSVSTGGDTPVESISLNYTKIEMAYNPMGKDGDPLNTRRAAYDLASTATS